MDWSMSSAPSTAQGSRSSICSITSVRTAARLAAGAGAVLAAWLAFSVAFAFVVPPGRSVAVIAPAGAETIAAAGGLLLNASGPILITRSDDPGYVQRLYAA